MITKSSHPTRGYLLYVCLAAACGGLLFGYDTAVISGAIGFLTEHFELSSAQMGWAASSALAGCIIGVCLAGTFSDRYGRKKILLCSALLFLIPALLYLFNLGGARALTDHEVYQAAVAKQMTGTAIPPKNAKVRPYREGEPSGACDHARQSSSQNQWSNHGSVSR